MNGEIRSPGLLRGLIPKSNHFGLRQILYMLCGVQFKRHDGCLICGGPIAIESRRYGNRICNRCYHTRKWIIVRFQDEFENNSAAMGYLECYISNYKDVRLYCWRRNK